MLRLTKRSPIRKAVESSIESCSIDPHAQRFKGEQGTALRSFVGTAQGMQCPAGGRHTLRLVASSLADPRLV
jgi:hypothetical protein